MIREAKIQKISLSNVKKDKKHLSYHRKSVLLQADYYRGTLKRPLI